MRQSSLTYIVAIVFVLVPSALRGDERPLVQFDLPPTVAATPMDDPNLVSVTLYLSSMIESSKSPPISHWMVRCIPRDETIRIADYAPRTETGSDVSTPIQIKKTTEQSQSAGISLDGAYSHLTQAHIGSDRGSKATHAIEYDRVAPVQAVTAAGTIHRGQGVYFKLRWTATQVLEGEKKFQITMRVPTPWRGGLIDVSVVAISDSTSSSPWPMPNWDRNPKAIGRANFVVAAYRSGDTEAEILAQTVSTAERKLRRLSEQSSRRVASHSIPSMLRRVARKLDLKTESDQSRWVQRLLAGTADPHFDKQIRKLPMPIRVAVLDYVDRRDEFNAIQSETDRSVIAAKPAL